MTKLFKVEVKKIAKGQACVDIEWGRELTLLFLLLFSFLFSSSFSSKGLPATSLEKEMLITVVFKNA